MNTTETPTAADYRRANGALDEAHHALIEARRELENAYTLVRCLNYGAFNDHEEALADALYSTRKAIDALPKSHI